MALFNNVSFIKHDDYMTPKIAWENIKNIIPRDKIIWEPFYGDGNSGKYLSELGFNVIHEANVDFFENNKGDIVVSNPPFSKIKEILQRLILLDKPFILIMPISKITTGYFKNVIGNDIEKTNKLHILIPNKRIQFYKLIDGNILNNGSCNFDCIYYCYKIETLNTKPAIIWL